MTNWHVGRVAILSAFMTTCALTSPVEAASAFQATADFVVGSEDSKVYDGSRLNLGAGLSLAPRGWPVGLTFFGTRSSDVRDCPTECGELHEKLTQAGIGVRREWDARIHPSLAGGFAWSEQRTDIEDAFYVGENTGYTERALGWWVGANASLRIADPFHVGGGVRYSRVDQDVRGYDFWYQTWSVYASLGLTWPAEE